MITTEKAKVVPPMASKEATVWLIKQGSLHTTDEDELLSEDDSKLVETVVKMGVESYKLMKYWTGISNGFTIFTRVLILCLLFFGPSSAGDNDSTKFRIANGVSVLASSNANPSSYAFESDNLMNVVGNEICGTGNFGDVEFNMLRANPTTYIALDNYNGLGCSTASAYFNSVFGTTTNYLTDTSKVVYSPDGVSYSRNWGFFSRMDNGERQLKTIPATSVVVATGASTCPRIFPTLDEWDSRKHGTRISVATSDGPITYLSSGDFSHVEDLMPQALVAAGTYAGLALERCIGNIAPELDVSRIMKMYTYDTLLNSIPITPALNIKYIANANDRSWFTRIRTTCGTFGVYATRCTAVSQSATPTVGPSV